MKEEKIDLFVPGRIAILGEFSDISVEYQKKNKTIPNGEVIAGGIEQGIYASAKKSKDFYYAYNEDIIEIKNMNLEELYKTAQEKGFYSFVCSTAYKMKTTYPVEGIQIKINKMDLPIQKGLSSSAAVCVLIVKAFNELYHLKLDTKTIMELAYNAEREAHSKCGRLDQICAKGIGISHIIFKGKRLVIKPLKVSKNLHFVIGDVNGYKNTKKILEAIHNCFPYPKTQEEDDVTKTMGEWNHKIIEKAIKSIEKGNRKELGKQMNLFQKNIDNYIGKICDDIKGPILHKVMSDTKLQEYSYGMKGSGSNGDGAILILAKNKKNQLQIIEYLKTKYNIDSFKYNIEKNI